MREFTGFFIHYFPVIGQVKKAANSSNSEKKTHFRKHDTYMQLKNNLKSKEPKNIKEQDTKRTRNKIF